MLSSQTLRQEKAAEILNSIKYPYVFLNDSYQESQDNIKLYCMMAEVRQY